MGKTETEREIRAKALEDSVKAVQAACGFCNDGILFTSDGGSEPCEYCGPSVRAIRSQMDNTNEWLDDGDAGAGPPSGNVTLDTKEQADAAETPS